MWLASVQRTFPTATVSFEDAPRQETICTWNKFLQEEREGTSYGPQREKKDMDSTSFPIYFPRNMKCCWTRLYLYTLRTLELRLTICLLPSPELLGQVADSVIPKKVFKIFNDCSGIGQKGWPHPPQAGLLLKSIFFKI